MQRRRRYYLPEAENCRLLARRVAAKVRKRRIGLQVAVVRRVKAVHAASVRAHGHLGGRLIARGRRQSRRLATCVSNYIACLAANWFRFQSTLALVETLQVARYRRGSRSGPLPPSAIHCRT